MGNTAARQRLKAQDFAYISRNTAFLSRDVSFTFTISTISVRIKIIIHKFVKIVSDYYTELMSRCPDGKMEPEVMTMMIAMTIIRNKDTWKATIFKMDSELVMWILLLAQLNFNVKTKQMKNI